MLKTPEFWYKDEKPPSGLKPAAWVYDGISRIHRKCTSAHQVSKPVICVGNITMGGSGKTPVAISIAEILKDLGYLPHFLSRGYGGCEKGPYHIQTETDLVKDVGDEPLLLSKHAPCWIAKDKLAGARAAIEAGAGSVVMDDGYQNPSLKKDISLLVIDGVRGFGNGCVFPAGPLRETPSRALARASACVILNASQDQKDDWRRMFETLSFTRPVFFADFKVEASIKGERLVGFAGLGIPHKFYDTLIAAGADVKDFFPFPDHHNYSEKDLRALTRSAKSHKASLITTEKDMVRLPGEMKNHIKTLPISLQWHDLKAITAFLKKNM